MTDLSLEDIEFIKILANSDSILQADMNEATRYRLDAQIGCDFTRILQRKYHEHKNRMDRKI
jgi:hypothetical protein